MAVTNEQLLEYAREALSRRLQGDAYISYSKADRRFEGCTLKELRDTINELERKVAAGSSTSGGISLVQQRDV